MMCHIIYELLSCNLPSKLCNLYTNYVFSHMQTFCNYCTKRELEVRCDWPEFTFTSDEMKLMVPHTTSGWMVEVQSLKNKVRKHVPLQLLLNLSCMPSYIDHGK